MVVYFVLFVKFVCIFLVKYGLLVRNCLVYFFFVLYFFVVRFFGFFWVGFIFRLWGVFWVFGVCRKIDLWGRE